ncbi:MAG: hypothetical protein ACLFTL_07620 [Alphaproteobacteria bacterium]
MPTTLDAVPVRPVRATLRPSAGDGTARAARPAGERAEGRG